MCRLTRQETLFAEVHKKSIGKPVDGGVGEGWKKKHTARREAEGLEDIPFSCRWSTRNASLCRGISASARTLDVLDLAMEVTLKRKPHLDEATAEKMLFADVSQCGSRSPWTMSTLRSVTTSTDFFSFARKRAVLPAEVFRLLGFTKVNTRGLGAGDLKDLVGEAMPLPPMSVLIVSLLTSIPGFWSAY